jgi:hypothetical protein
MSNDKINMKFLIFIYLFYNFYEFKPRSIPFVSLLKLLECFVGKSDIHIFKMNTTIKIEVINT